MKLSRYWSTHSKPPLNSFTPSCLSLPKKFGKNCPTKVNQLWLPDGPPPDILTLMGKKSGYLWYFPPVIAWFLLMEFILRAFQLYLDYFGRANGIYFSFINLYYLLTLERIISPLITISYLSNTPALIYKLFAGITDSNLPIQIINLSNLVYRLSIIPQALLIYALFKKSIYAWYFLVLSTVLVLIKDEYLNGILPVWLILCVFVIPSLYMLFKIKKFYK